MGKIRRSYNTLNNKTKALLINDYTKNNQTYEQLAVKYKIGVTTVGNIIKNKTTLLANSSKRGFGKKRRIKPAKHPKLEEAVFNEYVKMRGGKIMPGGTWIQERARDLAESMKIVKFKGSNQWLSGFKTRFGLSTQKICGEEEKVNIEDWHEWIAKYKATLEEYPLCDIFNVDETGLYYRMLPTRAVCFVGEKCHGGVKSKERVTAMLATNWDGSEKLPLLIIGKSRKPRPFPYLPKTQKHYSLGQLGCLYRNQASSWMDREIFAEWINNMERKCAATNRKVLMLLDNFSCHYVPDLKLKFVRLLFLPPNTTSKSQPLDQGIIQNMKAHYKKGLINYYWSQLVSQESEKVVKVKEIDLFQGVQRVVDAWNAVKPETIQKCFSRSLPGVHVDDPDATEDEDDDLADNPIVSSEVSRRMFTGSMTFMDYVNADSQLITSDELSSPQEESTDGLPNVEAPISEDEVESDQEGNDEESTMKVSTSDAIKAVNTIMKYNFKGELLHSEINKAMSSCLDYLIKDYYSQKKQSDIRGYFQKQ